MSLQWQAVAISLYVQLFITLILILPILRPSTWKSIFNLRLFSSLKPIWKSLFYSVLLILVVLFVDSIRTMMKYPESSFEKPNLSLDTKLDFRLKQCRGQRNFYITGMSLFLMFVIYRLVVLLYERAGLEANHQAVLSQAQGVSRELQRRLDEATNDDKPDKSKETREEEKEKYLTRITELEKEVKHVLADRDTMRKQADSLRAEYDRLSEEHQLRQLLLNASNEDDKKDR